MGSQLYSAQHAAVGKVIVFVWSIVGVALVPVSMIACCVAEALVVECVTLSRVNILITLLLLMVIVRNIIACVVVFVVVTVT